MSNLLLLDHLLRHWLLLAILVVLHIARHLKFTKDFITSTPYVGNPLAIVHLPSTVQLSQAVKLLFAHEFNLLETVFLHKPNRSADPASPVVIDRFLTTAEVPFAGHLTIGTGFYLLSRAQAGDGHVVHENKRYSRPPWSGGCLFAGSSHAARALWRSQVGAWLAGGLVSVSLYVFPGGVDGVVRTRMFGGTREDPAAGSTASTLGSVHTIDIEQAERDMCCGGLAGNSKYHLGMCGGADSEKAATCKAY
ncbi:hypothetical protein C8F04DRAFT_1177578 [Mycena alexandri]|uniref:Uncharacterized protein n=1 Tax=Mycena alexandri TaxID=1745969 RepID=A0AAD6T8U3_9AGAR|nr:hypothetical protein C8F04DRAFT_1177578 [Mycena alexandri]